MTSAAPEQPVVGIGGARGTMPRRDKGNVSIMIETARVIHEAEDVAADAVSFEHFS